MSNAGNGLAAFGKLSEPEYGKIALGSGPIRLAAAH